MCWRVLSGKEACCFAVVAAPHPMSLTNLAIRFAPYKYIRRLATRFDGIQLLDFYSDGRDLFSENNRFYTFGS
jgi:hypothetical protein